MEGLGGQVAARLAEVRERVARACESPRSVRIMAVTKGFGLEAVQAAAAAGLEDIGENYAQEMLSKLAGAPAGLRWHFLGRLQRNKLARLAPYVYRWHGLDSEAGAAALARRRPGAAVLVEVRARSTGPRPGADPGDVPALVSAARAAGLDVRGLMTVAPWGVEPRAVAAHFKAVARLAGDLALPELSMGMTDDFELAVAAGATIVRLGRALFGERPARART